MRRIQWVGWVLFLAGWMSSRAAADQDLYKKVAPSCVLIYDGGHIGSGVLINANQGLIVTAEHVIRHLQRMNQKTVPVIFPLLDSKGEVFTDAMVYKKRRTQLAVPAEIIYYNRTKDLALLRVGKVPPQARTLPLASTSPRPGQQVHVIGNSTFSDGGAFGYSVGNIRALHYFTRPTFIFYSVTHHVPSNQGDSGGPVVNDQGELVAIISQGTTGSQNQQIVDHSVHVGEIRRMLEGVQQPSGDTVQALMNVDSRGLDFFFLPVQNQEKVSVNLAGNGNTDLDLLAEDFDFSDPKTNKIGRYFFLEEGTTDKERGEFTPQGKGYVRIGVKNLFQGKSGSTSTPTNQYTLTIKSSQGITGPWTIKRRIAAKATDSLRFFYQANKIPARITVRGDGDTDLDLVVTDPNNKPLVQKSGLTDREQADWTPPITGYYTIQIRNMGDIWNEYILTTD